MPWSMRSVTQILHTTNLLDVALHLDEMVDEKGYITAKAIHDRYPTILVQATRPLYRTQLITPVHRSRARVVTWKLSSTYKVWKEYYKNKHPGQVT